MDVWHASWLSRLFAEDDHPHWHLAVLLSDDMALQILVCRQLYNYSFSSSKDIIHFLAIEVLFTRLRIPYLDLRVAFCEFLHIVRKRFS